MPDGIGSHLPGRIAVAVLVLVPFLGGCTTYSRHATSMRDDLLTGRADLARLAAEQEDPDENDVLASLNKGMLRRMTGDYRASNQIFEVAKQRMESLYGVSISETAASLTINDAVRGYEGDRYEQVLLHAYMAMNYLQLGEPDSARVEMLQADVKMMEWGEQPEEDPFVRYFAGMIYEALGEDDQALVSYRKARDVYLATRDKQLLDVPLMLKRDLLRLLAGQELWNEYRAMQTEFGLEDYQPVRLGENAGELIVLLNSGLAPIRTETAVMTYSPEVQANVRIAFPVYATEPRPAKRARLNIDGRRVDLETVENIDGIARDALDDDMPLVMTRAIARAVVKYQSQKKANEQDALVGFLLTVTNLATERADTRSWTTLPREIQMARVMLPAGAHEASIEIISTAGTVIDSIDLAVDIAPMKRSFVTRHWAAPVPARPLTANSK